jgi:hypothetical protein
MDMPSTPVCLSIYQQCAYYKLLREIMTALSSPSGWQKGLESQYGCHRSGNGSKFHHLEYEGISNPGAVEWLPARNNFIKLQDSIAYKSKMRKKRVTGCTMQPMDYISLCISQSSSTWECDCSQNIISGARRRNGVWGGRPASVVRKALKSEISGAGTQPDGTQTISEIHHLQAKIYARGILVG